MERSVREPNYWLDKLKKQRMGKVPSNSKVEASRGQPLSVSELIEMVAEQCPLLSEDRQHIEKGMLTIPTKWHQQLADRYLQTWCQAYEDEPGDAHKENAGRREANLVITRMLRKRNNQ